MKAYRVLLTHFSQRYHYVPKFEKNCATSNRTMVAFDGLSFNLLMLPNLPKFMPLLEEMFLNSNAVSKGVDPEQQRKRPKISGANHHDIEKKQKNASAEVSLPPVQIVEAVAPARHIFFDDED